MTAPVNNPPPMQAAPPKGANVGVQLSHGARWIPLIVDRMDEHGTVYFRFPPKFGYTENVRAAFSLRHTDWCWKHADECAFERGCPTCRARGAHLVNGREVVCDRCKGEGVVPDRTPFR